MIRRAGARAMSDAAAATAERILAAAIERFAASGFAGTTTRAVAGAAGVNIATLAYHFGGKEGLYRAAIDRLYERLLAVEPTAELLAPAPPEAALERVVRFAWRFARAHRTEVRLLVRHVIEQGALPEQVREGWTQRLLDMVALAWGALGLPPDPNWRLKVLTFNHVLVRYAITEAQDLAPFTDAPDVDAALEEHLVDVARRLVGL